MEQLRTRIERIEVRCRTIRNHRLSADYHRLLGTISLLEFN